jgi:hypothetical protein
MDVYCFTPAGADSKEYHKQLKIRFENHDWSSDVPLVLVPEDLAYFHRFKRGWAWIARELIRRKKCVITDGAA